MRPLLIYCKFVVLIFVLCYTESTYNQAQILSRSVPSNTNGLPETSSQQVEPVCGGWLNTNYGSIYHKPFDPVIENERCVWIIGVPAASAYEINIEYLGYPTNKPPGYQELIITGVTYGNILQPNLTSYKPTETGGFTVANANIVIVSFHTGLLDSSPRTGFVLLYEAILEGITSKLSTHHVLTSPIFEFKYPPDRTSYENNELAALVFPPSNNQYECSSKIVRYKELSLDLRYDNVFVYNYNVSSVETTGYWQYSHNASAEAFVSTFNDVVLFLFQSDSSTVFRGFLTDFVAC